MLCYNIAVLLSLGHVWLQANLHGVLPVYHGSFASLQQNALRWSNRLKQACAVCHSLSMVGKGSVAGLDVERALFKAVEARFLVSLCCAIIVCSGTADPCIRLFT